MLPSNCSFCNGKLLEGKTDYIVKIRNELISINNVPAYICENCEESYINPQTSKKIDSIMNAYHKGKFLARPIAAGEIEFDLEAA